MSKSGVIAPERRGVRQQEVRDEDGLRAPQMGVRRHDRAAALLSLIRQHRHECGNRMLRERNAPLQVEPQIERDLLVSGTTGVQAPPGLANAEDELALDERMDVFVGGRRRGVEECRVVPATIRESPRGRGESPRDPKR